MNFLVAKRARIQELTSKGYTVRQISAETGYSKSAVQRAITYQKKYKTSEIVASGGRTRATTSREDRIIRRKSETNRKKTASDIHKEIQGNILIFFAVFFCFILHIIYYFLFF